MNEQTFTGADSLSKMFQQQDQNIDNLWTQKKELQDSDNM